MAFTTIDGITLHYMLGGAGDQPSPGSAALVLINSLGTDLRIWGEVVEHLDRRLPLLRYDFRGHGLSDVPPGPYAIGDHTQDLDGLLGYLGWERVVLVGISVGGLIALDYAHRFPQKTQGLVVCNSAAQIGSAAYWGSRIDALEAEGMEAMAETIVSRWFAPTFAREQPATYRGYLNMFSRMPLPGYTGTCAALGAADLRETARTIRTRALVLAGAEDLATPPDLVQGLADSLPDARFMLIQDAGHLSCVEQPMAVAAAIDYFVEKVGSSGDNS